MGLFVKREIPYVVSKKPSIDLSFINPFPIFGEDNLFDDMEYVVDNTQDNTFELAILKDTIEDFLPDELEFLVLQSPKVQKQLTVDLKQLTVDLNLLKLDIEDVFRKAGLTTINGKQIRFGNKQRRSANASYGAKNSHHKEIDPHTGNANARDISIIGGTHLDYEAFKNKILSTPEIVKYLDNKGWGIINEVIPLVLSRTRGTGWHFHFGPDKWAKKIYATWKNNPKMSVTTFVSSK